MDQNTPGPVVLEMALRRFMTKRSLAKALGTDPRTVIRWGTGSGLPLHWKLSILYLLDHPNVPKERSGDFTFIDLFAGIGGMRMGFEAQRGLCEFTSEWDMNCQRTYERNFGEDEKRRIYGDISQITKHELYEQIPPHDVLLAGFPCQPFSIAGVSKKKSLGRAHGFACEAQGTLFFDVAKIIEKSRPRAFVLENVKNLRSHDGGNTFKIIKKILEEDLGYTFSPALIDARGFVPQHRERIFIVGFRRDVGFSWDSFRRPEASSVTLGGVLHSQNGSELAEEPYTTGKRAKVSDKYTLSDKLWNYLQAYKQKHESKGNGFGFGLFGPDDVARTLSARYYKDGSEILIRQARKNPRRLTPRECARLMGFDTSERKFEIPVSDTSAYKQFGNSVVVPVVREVARIVKPFIMQLREMEEAGADQQALIKASTESR